MLFVVECVIMWIKLKGVYFPQVLSLVDWTMGDKSVLRYYQISKLCIYVGYKHFLQVNAVWRSFAV